MPEQFQQRLMAKPMPTGWLSPIGGNGTTSVSPLSCSDPLAPYYSRAYYDRMGGVSSWQYTDTRGGSNIAVSDIVRQASTGSGVASHSSLTRITTVRHQAGMASQQADRQADRRRGNARSFWDLALPLSNCGRATIICHRSPH